MTLIGHVGDRAPGARGRLPATAVYHLVQGPAVGLGDGCQGTPRGVPEADQIGDEVVVRDAEDGAGLVLVADG